ncbi:MAG: hypothetical protein ACLQU3_05885 [Limisphaerales bacterium]
MSDSSPDNQFGPATCPVSFKVIGVDRQTGNDVETVVTALTEANARVKAELKGIVVTCVAPAPPAEEPTNPVPSPSGPPAMEWPAPRKQALSHQPPSSVEIPQPELPQTQSPQPSPPAPTPTEPPQKSQQQSEPQATAAPAPHDAAEQFKIATLLYVLLLAYLLFTSASAAWKAVPKDQEALSSGVAVSMFLVNTLIGFVERALLTPLYILCLAAYACFAWRRRREEKKNRASQPEAGHAKDTETQVATAPSDPVHEPAARTQETTTAPNASQETNDQTEPPDEATSYPAPSPTKIERPGLKPAAMFLIINAVLTFLVTAFLQGGATNALTNSTLYRSMFFGDIICALALLSGRDGWRWYVIARSIYGALYWGIATPWSQGTPVALFIGFAQLLFLGGQLALVLIKGPSKLRLRWAIASMLTALVAMSALNAVRYTQYQQTKRNLLATMPWISPHLMDIFLKEIASRNLTESQFQEFFSTTLEKGQQTLTQGEHNEITQIYGIALNSLRQDEAVAYSACAKKMRSNQPLTEAETDQMLQLTTQALSALTDPHRTRYQELITKAFEAGKQQPAASGTLGKETPVKTLQSSADASETSTSVKETPATIQSAPTALGVVSGSGFKNMPLGCSAEAVLAVMDQPQEKKVYGTEVYYLYKLSDRLTYLERRGFLRKENDIKFAFDQSTLKLKKIFIEDSVAVTTDRGIKFGDEIAKVLKLYGTPTQTLPENIDSASEGWLRFKNAGITFDFHDRVVTGFDIVGMQN